MARTTVQLRRRSLKFYALHTCESLTTTYWENGHYIPEELDRVNYVLRDFRANEVKPIDPTLLDLLTRIHHRLGTNEPFQVISGYRSPSLTRCSMRTAKASLSTACISKAKRSTSASRDEASRSFAARALAQQAGGVGYYPKTDFVHVDTGRVRFW